jgi:hypothetical protein
MKRKVNQSDSATVLTETVVMPPGTPEWITVELIRLTLKVWQKHYKEPLSTQDAVTIILNAGQLFGILALE